MATPTSPPQHGSLARLGARLLPPAALFDDWLIAESEATLALEAWRTARPFTKTGAHETYVAALDREENAAAVLATCVRMAA
jgi:hypothetical protein